MKVRRVDSIHTCAQSYFASTVRLAVFLTKLLYVLLRTFPPSPVFHLRTRLQRINPSPEDLSSVATDVAKEDSCRAPKSAVHCLRGDRPPSSQPGGMSKIKFRSSLQNDRIIPKCRDRNQARRFYAIFTGSHCKFPHCGADAVFCFFPIKRNQHPRHGHCLGIDKI